MKSRMTVGYGPGSVTTVLDWIQTKICSSLHTGTCVLSASSWLKFEQLGRTPAKDSTTLYVFFFCVSGVPALRSPSVVIRPASPHFHQQPVKFDAAATLKEGAPCEIYLAVPISWPLFFPPPGLKRHRRLCLCSRAAPDQKLNLHKLTN